MKRLHVNYEFDEYEEDSKFDEALVEFLRTWGWKRAGSGLNLIKHERDMKFEKKQDVTG
jgi:hypothetical protein